ncbi:ABC transporter substrate-binding protein [Mesorhizobium retamae]|uniref:ABC transporter substrate-binding protein n=1 Tax=Mesorhizobium retamae TaxID=2912854 RepID=A0ABS9QHI2_9HYPH|nr:ABC transporter substrate-binding protein [Mesorhizobium sp. IRAMC:0171]MCG7506888.1 ABC transporter substrate-binding protein [Mesorhizobium sp. IRAMC:0171]
MKKSNECWRGKTAASFAIAVSGLMLAAGAAQAESVADLLPKKYRDAGVINLVTDAKYPPFQYIDDAGKMVGFEVDLWNAIAERLKVKMNVTSVSFDSMIPGVQSGRWDISMEGITDNAERQAVVSFVDYGYTTSSAYVLETKGADINDHLALCGLKGAAQSGTEWVGMITAELATACTEAGKPAPTVSEFGTSDATLLSVYSGRTDFVLTSAASAQEIKKAAPNPVKVVPMPILPRKPSGIAFRKNEEDLGKALLAALKEVRADGTYDKIYSTWSVDPMKMEHEPGINLETVPAK